MKTVLGGLLAVRRGAGAGSVGEAVSQTFAAPVDRVWAATEALLTHR